MIAEEVAKVNPALVLLDKEGKPYTVRYDQVNAMLLNEFLKEHKTVQQQGQTIARLEKQLQTMAATLQKVSAQLKQQTVSDNGFKRSIKRSRYYHPPKSAPAMISQHFT